MVDNNFPYKHILTMPHHVSKTRPQMSRLNRAAQFAPFAALTGHDEAVKETARLTDAKLEIDEYTKEELNRRILYINENINLSPEVSITYFVPDSKKSGGAYVTESGVVSKIKEYEKTEDTFIFGLEESYGYLKGTYARDKDAVVAAMLICEMAADCKERGISVLDYLEELYKKHGYHREILMNYTFKGVSGEEKIKNIMNYFRESYTPDGLTLKKDYKDGIDGLPKSDVIKFFLNDGWMAVRPSGTEPKIKFYVAKVASSLSECDEKIKKIATEIEKIVNR